ISVHERRQRWLSREKVKEEERKRKEEEERQEKQRIEEEMRRHALEMERVKQAKQKESASNDTANDTVNDTINDTKEEEVKSTDTNSNPTTVQKKKGYDSLDDLTWSESESDHIQIQHFLVQPTKKV
ncbi:protein binding protein, partial [Reticulomyxa filosa]